MRSERRPGLPKPAGRFAPGGFPWLELTPGSGSTAGQHPGFHLQIIVLALAGHFFLMRFEIIHALPDFVAL
jgi:hypothetical protein